jgi:expansin (peptidoglycan-binding protein)
MRGALLAAPLLWLAAGAAATEVGCPARIEKTGTTATYYEDITTNACGLPVAPGDSIAAVVEAEWDGSSVCGRCARVSDGLGRETVVTITDYCPALGNPDCIPGHLDLSPAAFGVFAPEVQGELSDLRWETVACPVSGNLVLFADGGGSPYYLALGVRNHRYGVARVERRNAGSGAWVEMPRRPWNRFEHNVGQLEFPVALRLTDVHGQVVETSLASLPAGDVDVPTSVQFPVTCPEPEAAALLACAALGALRLRRVR